MTASCNWLAATLVALMAISAARAARAETPPPAPPVDPVENDEAERLFREGVKEFRAGHLPEAEELFTRALALRKAADVAANLATTQLRQQKYRLAATHFQLALETLPAGADPERKATLLQQFAKAKAHVGIVRLSVNVEAQVQIDQESPMRIEPDAPRPLFFDPGPHRLKVQADGHDTHEEPINATAGMDVSKTIDLALEQHEAAIPLWAPLAVGGVAAVGFGLGIAGFVLAGSANDDAEALRTELGDETTCSTPGTNAASCSALASATDDRSTFGTLGLWGFVGGGVFLAGSVVLGVLHATGGDAGAAAIQISPTLGGLMVLGQF